MQSLLDEIFDTGVARNMNIGKPNLNLGDCLDKTAPTLSGTIFDSAFDSFNKAVGADAHTFNTGNSTIDKAGTDAAKAGKSLAIGATGLAPLIITPDKKTGATPSAATSATTMDQVVSVIESPVGLGAITFVVTKFVAGLGWIPSAGISAAVAGVKYYIDSKNTPATPPSSTVSVPANDIGKQAEGLLKKITGA